MQLVESGLYEGEVTMVCKDNPKVVFVCPKGTECRVICSSGIDLSPRDKVAIKIGKIGKTHISGTVIRRTKKA